MMASKRLERKWRAFAVAVVLIIGPGSAVASEVFLCGADGTAAGAAGFIDLIPDASNPPAPPEGNTSACMPALSFDGNLVFVSATVGGGSPVRASRISVTLPRNVNATRLTQLLATGTQVTNLTLIRTVRAPATGAFRLAHAIALTDASVTSIQTSASAAGGPPVDVLTLDFTRIRWSTWPDPLASPLPAPVSSCWNLSAAAIC
jgi:type VI protein secretion system component Hcp